LLKRAKVSAITSERTAIREREADVGEQCRVKVLEALLAIGIAGRVHLAQHERMAADRALPEDDQAAREDVGTLDGDRDRDRLVAAAQIVARAQADRLATMHVHRIARHAPREFGDVVLENAGRDRRACAGIDRRGGDAARRIHRVGEPDHARDHLLDALEAPDRRVELAADCARKRRWRK